MSGHLFGSGICRCAAVVDLRCYHRPHKVFLQRHDTKSSSPLPSPPQIRPHFYTRNCKVTYSSAFLLIGHINIATEPPTRNALLPVLSLDPCLARAGAAFTCAFMGRLLWRYREAKDPLVQHEGMEISREQSSSAKVTPSKVV